MNWKFFVYDWGSWNVALFHVINSGMPGALDPVVWCFDLIGNYRTVPFLLLGFWRWSISAPNLARACAVRQRLVMFGLTFAPALLAVSALKWRLDLPRSPAVLGHLVHVIGEPGLHHSLPDGHLTFVTLVVGVFWPLVGFRGRLASVFYVALVGWSRVVAGMHFLVDVVAGWMLGASSVAIAGSLRSALVSRQDVLVKRLSG